MIWWQNLSLRMNCNWDKDCRNNGLHTYSQILQYNESHQNYDLDDFQGICLQKLRLISETFQYLHMTWLALPTAHLATTYITYISQCVCVSQHPLPWQQVTHHHHHHLFMRWAGDMPSACHPSSPHSPFSLRTFGQW